MKNNKSWIATSHFVKAIACYFAGDEKDAATHIELATYWSKSFQWEVEYYKN